MAQQCFGEGLRQRSLALVILEGLLDDEPCAKEGYKEGPAVFGPGDLLLFHIDLFHFPIEDFGDFFHHGGLFQCLGKAYEKGDQGDENADDQDPVDVWHEAIDGVHKSIILLSAGAVHRS